MFVIGFILKLEIFDFQNTETSTFLCASCLTIIYEILEKLKMPEFSISLLYLTKIFTVLALNDKILVTQLHIRNLKIWLFLMSQ